MVNSFTIQDHVKAAILAASKQKMQLAKFLVAQAVLETGWNSLHGNGTLGKALNFWGRKELNTKTKKGITVSTKEQKPDGTEYTIKAVFRDYREYGAKTLGDAYLQQLACMRNSSFVEYRNVANGNLDELSLRAYCKRYATDVKYYDKVMAVFAKLEPYFK